MNIAFLADQDSERSADCEPAGLIPRLVAPSRVLSVERTEDDAWYEIYFRKPSESVFVFSEVNWRDILIGCAVFLFWLTVAAIWEPPLVWVVLILGTAGAAGYITDEIHLSYFDEFNRKAFWQLAFLFGTMPLLAILDGVIFSGFMTLSVALVAPYQFAWVEGSQETLQRARKRLITYFAATATPLLVAEFMAKHFDPQNPVLIVFVMFGIWPFGAFFLNVLQRDQLLQFLAPLPRTHFGVARKVPSMEQFRIGEIHLWESLQYIHNAKLTDEFWNLYFDEWDSADIKLVAGRLEAAEGEISKAAANCVDAFNNARAWVDAARTRLSELIVLAHHVLGSDDCDELKPSQGIDIKVIRALEKHLTAQSIVRDRLKLVARTVGGIHVLRAASVHWFLALVVGAGAVVEDRVRRMAVARELRFVEGEIELKAKAISNDLKMLDRLIHRRVIQHYRDIVRVGLDIEAELSEWAQEQENGNMTASKIDPAFARTLVEARDLCRRTVGD